MGYTARNFRGYLSGVSSLKASGTLTATRFLASSLGSAAAPAFAATTALDGGLYWISTAISAISAGGAAIVYGSASQVVLNLPALAASYVDFTQIAAPAAPGTTIARLYSVDSGASKNRLSAIFDSGAAQTVATEP